MSEPLPPACEGCGGPEHGSVGVGRICLTRALRVSRAETEAAKEIIRQLTARHAHQATPPPVEPQSPR